MKKYLLYTSIVALFGSVSMVPCSHAENMSITQLSALLNRLQQSTNNTICKKNYCSDVALSQNGYDFDALDTARNCFGRKRICGDAVGGGATCFLGDSGCDALGAYDVTQLNTQGNCFGVLKSGCTTYCSGSINTPEDTNDKGDVLCNRTPTCSEIKDNGFIAVQNGNCIGKPYDESVHFIDCTGATGSLPSYLIVLNGATDFGLTGSTNKIPRTQTDADTLFEQMIAVSLAKRSAQ